MIALISRQKIVYIPVHSTSVSNFFTHDVALLAVYANHSNIGHPREVGGLSIILIENKHGSALHFLGLSIENLIRSRGLSSRLSTLPSRKNSPAFTRRRGKRASRHESFVSIASCVGRALKPMRARELSKSCLPKP